MKKLLSAAMVLAVLNLQVMPAMGQAVRTSERWSGLPATNAVAPEAPSMVPNAPPQASYAGSAAAGGSANAPVWSNRPVTPSAATLPANPAFTPDSSTLSNVSAILNSTVTPQVISATNLTAPQLMQILSSGGNLFVMSAETQVHGNVVVPAGVTLVGLVDSANDSLAVSGHLTSRGDLVMMSLDPALELGTGNVSANRVRVGATGSLQTLNTPSTELGLNIDAKAGLSNSGLISSGADLTITAGSIVNFAMDGSPATIQAQGDINLLSNNGHIYNYGTIQGLGAGSNININAIGATTGIAVTGTGSYNSPAAINVGNNRYNQVLMLGGDYFSDSVNINAVNNTYFGSVGKITGALNSQGTGAHFWAQTDVFKLGNNCITGDPTYANTTPGGSIEIVGAQVFNENLAIMADGDVKTALNGAIAGQIIAHGSNVTIIAGAKVATQGNTTNGVQPGSEATRAVTVTLDPAVSSGGNIDFSTAAALNVIDTSSGTGGKSAGNVTLIAMSSNGGNGGKVLLGTSNIIANATGEGVAGTPHNGGNVTIIAGAAPSAKTATVTVNNIETGGSYNSGFSGTQGFGGSVSIYTQQPQSSKADKTITFDTLGNITGGVISPNGLTAKNAAVSVGNIITAGEGGVVNSNGHNPPGSTAGKITMVAGSDIDTKNLYAFGAGGTGAKVKSGVGPGGKGGDGGAISLTSETGNISVDGTISSSGGGGGGGVGKSGLGSNTAGGVGGKAGNITLLASTGNISVDAVYAVNGGAGGGGGANGNDYGDGGGGGGSYGGGGGGGGDIDDHGGGGGGGIFGGGGGGFKIPGAGGSGTAGGAGGGGGQNGTANQGGNGHYTSNGGGLGGALGKGGLGAFAGDHSGGNGQDATTSTASVQLKAGNSLTADGALLGGNVTLVAGGSGNMNLKGVSAFNGSAAITLGSGTLSQPASDKIVAQTLSITATTGTVGSQAVPVHTQSRSLAATTGGTGSIFLDNMANTTPLTLSKAAAPGGVFLISNAGSISTGTGVTIVAKTIRAYANGTFENGTLSIATQTTDLGTTASNNTVISNKGGPLLLQASTSTFGYTLNQTVASKSDSAAVYLNGLVDAGNFTININITAPAGQSGGMLETNPLGLLKAGTAVNIKNVGAGTIGQELLPIKTQTNGTLTMVNTGSIFLHNAGNVKVAATKVGSTTTASDTVFALTNVGSISISPGGITVQTAANYTSFLALNADGGILSSQPSSNLACLNCVLTAKYVQLNDASYLGPTPSGMIGTSTQPIQVKAAQLVVLGHGSAYISQSGPTLQVRAEMGTSPTTTFQLLSTGSITSSPGHIVQAARVMLIASAGSVGTATTPVQLDTAFITLRAPDSVFAHNASTANVTIGPSVFGVSAVNFNSNAGNTFAVLSPSAPNLSTVNELKAKTITVTAQNIAIASPITTTGSVTLAAAGGTPSTISISHPIKAGTLSLDAPSVTQSPGAPISATTVNITSSDNVNLSQSLNKAGTLNLSVSGGSTLVNWKQNAPMKLGTVSGTPNQLTILYTGSLTTTTPFTAGMLTLAPLDTDANNSLTTNGVITIAGNDNTTLTASGTGTLNIGGVIGAGSGARNLTTGAGNMKLSGPLTGQVVTLSTTGGSISNTATGVVTAPGGLTINLNKAGTADLSKAVGNFSNFTDHVVGAGKVNVSSSQAVTLAATGPQQTLTVTAQNGITTPDPIEAIVLILSAGGPGISSPGQPLKSNAANALLTGMDTGSNIFVDFTNVGGTTLGGNAGSVFTATSVGTIATSGAVTAAQLNLEAAGNIVINAALGSPSSTVTLKTTGAGNITGPGTVTGQQMTLTTANGSAGAAGKPLQIATTQITANSTGGGFTLNNTASAQVVLNDSTAGKGFVLTTTGPLNVNSITTDAGLASFEAQIVITVTKGTLFVIPGSTISATGGNLQLQNLDTVSGTIEVGVGSTIKASSTVAGVGNVTLNVGTFSTPTAGTAPPNVVTNVTGGGKIFYGPSGGITSLPPDSHLNALERNITFNASKAGSIKLDGNITITADPPPGMENIQMALPGAARAVSFSADSQDISLSAATQRSALVNPDSRSEMALIAWLQAPSLVSSDTLSRRHNYVSSAWISETELVGGHVPADLVSDADLGVASIPPAPLTESKSQLVVAGKDRVIETPLGPVNIDAGSLVLMMSYGNSLAVYNLDDSHRDAVSVASGHHKFVLSPGECVVLTSSSARHFEQVNPAQLFGYRNIQTRDTTAGVRAFTGEFLVPSAARALAPMKSLLASKHPEAKRVTEHLLKTTAAALTLRAKGGQFKQMLRPSAVASL